MTKDKIVIVRFIAQSDPATEAILEGAALADDPAVVKGAYDALFKYCNQHFETYGREVVFQDYNASGPDDNDEQMRADAGTHRDRRSSRSPCSAAPRSSARKSRSAASSASAR